MGILDRLSQKLSDIVDDLAAPDAIRGPLQRGAQALQEERFQDAEAALLQVVKQEPRSWRGWHLLGLSQLRGDKPAEAVRSLERALQLRPEEFALLAALGEALHRHGQLGPALQAYKAALHVRADESLLDQVFAGLGELYLERGDLDHAVRELRKAVAVSRADDPRLLGRLGMAQYRAGELQLARSSLTRAATAVPPEPEVVLLLARVLLDLGEPEEARLAALRLLQARPGSAPARCALARALLALGQREAAREELLRALGDDARSQEAHWLLGRVHAEGDDLEAALRHLRAADELGAGGPELWRELVDLGLELGQEQGPELQRDAGRLLAESPADPRGLAAGALGLADPEAVRQQLLASLAEAESFAGRLGQGLHHLGRGEPAEAAVALRAALRLHPGSRRARLLLARAHRAQSGLEAPGPEPGDLYPIIRRTHELLLSLPALSGTATEVARIQEVFDRPLLVTVMGEFNSGKSTFVNALIGERVAPMGVTPTTATINHLKYGPRRSARVIWRDDREELLEWPAVEPFLSGLDRRQASEIRLVEILFPSEELLRVNVIDTPGLNSLVDEHEQTAREVMAQADAVIWLFSAQQAGKQTEEQALELIAQHRLKTVGVLNKVDRLTEAELGAVLDHLRASFGALTEEIVPVSARDALEALIDDNQGALQQSRFPALRQILEERLFARGRAIKREAAERRLGALLLAAERQVGTSLEQTSSVAGLIDRLRGELGTLLPAQLMEQESGRLRAELEAVYRRGAEEVLDFVRPRRWALGEHSASAADRDFLLELLVDGLRGLTGASQARMAGQLRRAARSLDEQLGAATLPGSGGPPAGLGQLAEERVALLEQQVYTRYIAFARGFLLGGRIDQFFARRLPHLQLALEPIHEALREDSVDLDHELLAPLAAWYAAARSALQARLEAIRIEIELGRLELEERGLAPLLAMRERFRQSRS